MEYPEILSHHLPMHTATETEHTVNHLDNIRISKTYVNLAQLSFFKGELTSRVRRVEQPLGELICCWKWIFLAL